MSNIEVTNKLNNLADAFTERHGETLCLRANIAAINRMLIKRNRGEELLESFREVINGFEKNENSNIDSKS